MDEEIKKRLHQLIKKRNREIAALSILDAKRMNLEDNRINLEKVISDLATNK